MTDMRLYAFHAGGERGDMAVFDPFHPEVGTTVDIPYFVYLIQHPDGNVLFDLSGHRDLIDDPAGYLGPAADAFEVTMKKGDDVVSRIATVGLKPGDIDHVVLSHLHYDHAGGVQFFPDSKFHVQERELQFAHWPPVYQRELYLPSDFDHPVEWNELTGDYDLFGDGRVLIFPTPGHTAGHQSVLVRLSDDRSIILVADAAYVPRNLELSVLPAIAWSPDAMVASWRRIREMQRHYDAELIFTHDLSWEKTTRLGPDKWYE